jgi:predicted nucleic acid-binding protein
MMSVAAVLDACVLYPASLRDTLLRAASAGLCQPYWSEEILEEVRRNLAALPQVGEVRANHLIERLRTAFPEALVTSYERFIDRMDTHPEDRHVLAVAVVARAQVIVTHNLRHFPPKALTPYGIQAQDPDTFLLHLHGLDPDRMAHVILRQAAALARPSQTTEMVLKSLTQHAPGFTAAVRRDLQTIEGDRGSPSVP